MAATEKGFTLIEVLISTVVFSLALLGLQTLHLTAIRVNTIASRMTQATTLAQDRVERLMAMPYNDPMLVDNTNKDIFTSYVDNNPPQGYAIRWEVDTNAPTAGIKTINIVVSWKNLGKSKNFFLSMRKSNL